MNITRVLLYGMMFALFYGMWWANKQYKTKGVPWGRPLAALFGFATLGTALIVIIFMSSDPHPGLDSQLLESQSKNAKCQFVAYKFLGKEVAKQFPGAKVLLIRYNHGPASKNGKSRPGSADDIKIKALKEGLGGGIEIAAEEELYRSSSDYMKMNPGTGEIDPSSIYTPNTLDELVSIHEDCTVIISFIGLPQAHGKDNIPLAKMKLWKMEEGERPGLVLAEPHSRQNPKLIEHGRISAVLLNLPVPYDPTAPLPEGEQAIFDARYTIVTKGNIEDSKTKYPKMFLEADQ